MARVVLLTGGNVGDVKERLRTAQRLVNARIGPCCAVRTAMGAPRGASRPNSRSSIRCWWPTPISRRTRCSPRCTASSRELGRNRAAEAVERAATGQRYVSRPIDIDILLYDDEVISTPELTIPHPGIAEREFVLTPLCEVLRQRPHPVLGLTMGELRDNLLRKTK